MKLTIFVMLFGFVLAFAGFAFGSGENDSKEADPMEDTMEMGAGESDGTMTTGGWLHFTTLEDARMAAAKGPTLLLFNAAWCATCRAAVADIASRSGELGEITVIFVDYDSEKDLKRQYNVTSQHTYVQIDEDGEAVTVWNGGGVDQILYAVVETEKG